MSQAAHTVPPARNVAVFGAGDAGCAMAAAAASRGHRVRLWNRGTDRVAALADGKVRLTGPDGVTTIVPLDAVSTDPAEVGAEADLIIVAVSSSAQPEVVSLLWPAAGRARAVVLVPSHTGGVLAVRRTLGPLAETGPALAEMPLPFVCRGDGSGSVHIRQEKRDVPLAAAPESALPGLVDLVSGIFPAVRAAAGLWETGLGNTTAIIQPVLALANLARIDRGEDFAIYTEGVSPAVGRQIAALDRERLLLAQALGVNVPSVVEWFGEVYGVQGLTVGECIGRTPGYAAIAAPRSVDHRFLTEHVCTGAVPMSELAAAAGTPHAMLDALIELSSAAVGADLRAAGRRLEHMGLDPAALPRAAREVVR